MEKSVLKRRWRPAWLMRSYDSWFRPLLTFARVAYMEFNMLDMQEPLVVELKRLTKQAFNLEAILTVAGELKYTREIKRILNDELNAPSDEFVKFIAGQVYSGKLTSAVRGQFAVITKQAFTQFINEHITERLRSAMGEPAIPAETATETTNA